MIVRRETCGDPILQDRTQRRTRPRLLLIQSIQIRVSFIADNQTLIGVEHAKPLRHVLKGCIELKRLLLD